MPVRSIPSSNAIHSQKPIVLSMADEKKKQSKKAQSISVVKPVKRKAEDGRPRLEFNLKEVEALGAIQCTYEEMAAALCCSERTVTDRMKSDELFAEAYKRGVENGKMSVKRKQYTMAVAGDRVMLIWWGKQHLGQTDKVVQKNINAGSLALLTHLSPKERLEALKKGLGDNAATGNSNANTTADAASVK